MGRRRIGRGVWEDMLKGRQKTSEEELKKRYDLKLRVGSDGLKEVGGDAMKRQPK
jgi:hypothetical protein